MDRLSDEAIALARQLKSLTIIAHAHSRLLSPSVGLGSSSPPDLESTGAMQRNPLAHSHRGYKETGDLHSSRKEAQRQRRETALDRQRNSRSALFDLSRSVGDDLDECFEDMELEGEAEEPMKEVEMREPTATTARPHRHRRRQKWQRRFANKLMFAETLLDPSAPTAETPGLPSDLDTAWLALLVPKGKRCLALVLSTLAGSSGTSLDGPPNTLLLSRAQGRPITRRRTVLPANTILDCVFDEVGSVLYVLDALEWSGLPLSQVTAEGRRFWRDGKLAELPPQLLGDNRDRRLLVAAAPASDDVRSLITAATTSSLTVKVPIVRLSYPEVNEGEGEEMEMDGSTTTPVARPGLLELPIEVEGALLYLREALYESGASCLAGWLPKEGGALDAAAAQLQQEGGMTA